MSPSSDSESRGGEDPVRVAYARDATEAALIQGLLESSGIASSQQRLGIDGRWIGSGWLNPSGGGRGILVRADRAEQARSLLAEVLVEDPEALPEPANAEYLADASGHRPRGYGLLGAYARIYLWSSVVLAAAFAAFMVVRAL